MEMPHYWITNIQETKKIVGEYIKRSAHKYIELALKGSDNIVRDTFFVAARVASSGNVSFFWSSWEGISILFTDFKKKPMVQRALELWSASRIIEKTWRICGEDKLGLEVSMDLANPWNGIIPVTPMMDTQLDQIVIQDVLMPLRSGLLQELQKKIHGRRREDWFEIFLTVFILLSNTEFILAHSRRFARRYGMGVCFCPPRFHSMQDVDSYIWFNFRADMVTLASTLPPRAFFMLPKFCWHIFTLFLGATCHYL